MTEVQSLNAKGENGNYNICFRDDKPDVMTIAWNDTCIGMVKAGEKERRAFVEGIKNGKTFDEVWGELGIGIDVLDILLPMEPFVVFVNKDGKTEKSASYVDLETAQNAALQYLEGENADVTAYVCFITGRYYRDGAVTCLNNIYSKGVPDLKLPFAKVLGMDVGVFDLIFKDKCPKQ